MQCAPCTKTSAFTPVFLMMLLISFRLSSLPRTTLE